MGDWRKLTIALILASIAVLTFAALASAESQTWDTVEEFEAGEFHDTTVDLEGELVTLSGTESFGRYRENPILEEGSTGTYDGTSIYDPHLIHAEGMYHLYYTGYNGSYKVCYATSPDGYTFTKVGPVIEQGSSGDPDD